MNKTTKYHFELFQREVKKWIGFFNLQDWAVYFTHDKGEKDCKANIYFNKIQDRIVTINLSLNWSNAPLNNYQIRKSAFHEVAELFLYRLYEMAINRVCFERDLDEEVHRLIRVLENRLF